MATQAAKTPSKRRMFEPEAVESEVVSFIEHVKENPLLYVAGVAFVFICIVASLMYRSSVANSQMEAATQYARAMESEDPIARATSLKQVADSGGEFAARACYMMAEAYYEGGSYDEAKAAFERVRTEFADSPFVPDAIEGLGYIAENKGDSQGALALYQEIRDKHANSFTARRQLYNIGRCQEALGQLKEAIASYEEQGTAFPMSGADQQAQMALERLKKSHPDLFPVETPPAAATTPEGDAAPATEEAVPGVEIAPAADAPVTEVPVGEATSAEPAPSSETASPDTPAPGETPAADAAATTEAPAAQ